MGYYGGGGGGAGGGGTNQWVAVGRWPGPASYPTGGFTVDLSASFTTLNKLLVQIETPGNLAGLAFDYEITRNSPSAGKAKVKITKRQYNKQTSSFAATTAGSQPSGVTIRTTNGGTGSSESAHTHTIGHDHPSFQTGNATPGGGSVALQVAGQNHDAHAHNYNLPIHIGSTVSTTAHSHTDNTAYEHVHALTYTTANPTLTEIANGTNLSTSFFNMAAFGVLA